MKKIRNIIIPILLMISIAAYPIVFMYCKNVSETSFSEVIGLLLVFCFVAIMIWCICMIFIRELYKSTISAFLVVVVATNYMLIQKVFLLIGKELKYWHVLPIVLFVLGHVVYFIVKKVKVDILKDVINILTVVVIGLLAINYFPAIPKIIERSQKIESDKGSVDEAEHIQEGENVYWMIFDECASFSTIQKYYGHSEQTVYNFLEDSGFEISDTSYNESGNTVAILTNCLNLDYVVNSSMDATELSQYRVNPPLIELMKKEGYSIRGIGDTEWLGLPSVNFNGNNASQTVEGFGVEQLILQNTIIGPFIEYNGTKSAKLVLDTLEYMKDPSNFEPNSAQMNVMYVCSPHQPFLFDENGNAVQAINYNNWDDDKYYLGQYKFIMKEINAIVESILINDPESIIFISSDHGPRFKEEIPYQDKLSVLNALYYKGEDVSEIEGKSGVNTLRTIVNKMFGYEFADVEVKDGE